MKAIIIVIGALLASLETSPQSETGVIEGRVVRLGTDDGISGAQVTLTVVSVSRSLGAPTLARGAASPLRPVLTDARGYFAFRNLVPGQYSIRVQREGYLGPELAATGWYSASSSSNVTLMNAQTTPTIKLFLLKGGTITGRIFSPNGGTATGITVTTYRHEYDANGRKTFTMVSSRVTDQRGEYLITGLPPGAYFIAAVPQHRVETPKVASVPSTTFYPGELDGTLASRITVNPGNDVSGINITLRVATVVSILGTLDTGLLKGAAKPTFYLVSRDFGGSGDEGHQKAVDVLLNRASGRFEIPNVRPGDYDLIVVVPVVASDGATSLFPTRIPLDVGDRDLEGVKIVPGTPFTVSARLVLDGDPAMTKGVTLRLRSKESLPVPFDTAASLQASRDTSGTFIFPRVPQGVYTFEVNGLPPNGYVKYLLPGKVETGFRVPGDTAGPISVFISSAGERLQGITRNADRQPVANATIVLIPQNRQETHRHKTTTSDRNGTFTLSGIAPGQYELFTWEQIPRNAWMDPEFMATFAGRGTVVSVGNGSAVRHELTVLKGISKQ